MANKYQLCIQQSIKSIINSIEKYNDEIGNVQEYLEDRVAVIINQTNNITSYLRNKDYSLKKEESKIPIESLFKGANIPKAKVVIIYLNF